MENQAGVSTHEGAGADFGFVMSAIPKGLSSKLAGKKEFLRNRRHPKSGV